jgi:hypothetical protein
MPELSAQTRDKLKKVATPTLMTALYRRGLRNQWIQDVHLINPAATPMVGIAFTLRYMPARGDLNKLEVFRDRNHPQRAAVEQCPPGGVLAEITERIRAYEPPPRNYPRSYYRLFAQHTRQANEGCDFDFLEGAEGIPEPEIH